MMDDGYQRPERESWGGSFEKITHSSRVVFTGATTENDTIQRDGIVEWHLKGPKLRKGQYKVMTDRWSSGSDNEVGLLTVDKQRWPLYYLGNGNYMCRYATYKCGVISYTIQGPVDLKGNAIKGFKAIEGKLFVDNVFPGPERPADYKLGQTWWGDRLDPSLYSDREHCQGAKTVEKWRDEVMEDWGERCQWLK